MNTRTSFVRTLTGSALILIFGAAPTGTALADIITVPGDEPTIQDAIDAAVDTDEIIVDPGTYQESIDFLGKAIIVRSLSGPGVTTIDGSLAASSTVTMVLGEAQDSVLEGFTITGGTGSVLNPPDAFAPTGLLGGGVVCSSGGATIRDCIFEGNSAGIGGAIFCQLSSPIVTDCIFRNNNATQGGAVGTNFISTPAFINCLFYDNTSTTDGGAFYNAGISSPSIIACTITENTAGDEGGAVFNASSGPSIIGSLLWNNTSVDGLEVTELGGNPSQIDHSNIQGSGGSGGGWSLASTDLGGNIDQNPSFIDPANDNFDLCRFSPNIDAGRNDAVPQSVTEDLLGRTRFVDDAGVADTGAGVAPIIDIGAYEVQANSLSQMINLSPGESIQDVLQCAIAGDVINLAPGTYFQKVDFEGLPVTIRGSGGAAVTTIDGTGLGDSVFTCVNGEGPTTVIEGLTIIGGTGETTLFPTFSVGGAVVCVGSSPIIRDCIFDGNTADFGAAIYTSAGSPEITGNTFQNNEADVGGAIRNNNNTATISGNTFIDNIAFDRGGAIANTASMAVITDNQFTSNEGVNGAAMSCDMGSLPTIARNTFHLNSGSNGGAIILETSAPDITECIFSENSAALRGGALYLSDESDATFVNCVFSGNMALGFGGAMENLQSDPHIINCSFFGNTAALGGAMNNENGSMPMVSNSILFMNVAPQDPQVRSQAPAVATFRYCNVDGSGGSPAWDPNLGINASGNIDANPLFVNAAVHDLRLSAGSPSIDAGDNLFVPASTLVDLDGNQRIVDDPGSPDTGNPPLSPPYVDMGAYEFGAGPPPLCDSDTDGNNVVDIDDVINVILDFGFVGPNPPNNGDVNGDNVVDIDDVVQAVLDFGPC